MKLKVCGMKYKDNIKSVANLQPDYLGFIFYNKSSRHFNTNIPDVPKNMKKTGVFVDADIETIIEKLKTHQLQALQLHGSESVIYIKTLLCKLKPLSINKIEVIKVFSIKDDFDFSVLEPYEGFVDYFLFDTKGKLPGGNGYTFNWDVLKDYPSTTPYFLSGGIGLNEAKNIKAFKESSASKYCYAIDVNSKFEIKPGLKNTEQLKEFKKEIR